MRRRRMRPIRFPSSWARPAPKPFQWPRDHAYPVYRRQYRFHQLPRTSKVIPARADHGATQLMQPGPRGTIAPKPQNTLKAQCTDPRLLIGYVPHRLKPKFQRFPGILKNGPCSYGGLKITRSASIQTTVHDPKSFKTTPWTSKTFRPSQSRQIIDTGLFRGKFFFKFLHSSGIFLHKREYYI